MSRFVLLRHECPPEFEKPSHWDFMLEWDGVLRTWDLRELPKPWAQLFHQDSSSLQVAAQALPDHRLDYLNYEGPVTGDRGHVRRCDRGRYELLTADEGAIVVRIFGGVLRGVVHLSLRDAGWWLAVTTDEADSH